MLVKMKMKWGKLAVEQEVLFRTARSLAKEFRQRAAKADREECIPQENVDALTEAGLMGMSVPVAFGGKGESLSTVVRIVEEIAKGCGVSGRIVVDANLGVVGLVMAYGPEWMKWRVAELVIGGDKPAIHMSEPSAGTDVGGMKTRIEIRGSDVVINGSKIWITGADRSRVNLVVGRVIRGDEDLGIGAVYLERGTEGFRVGERLHMMGLRGMAEVETYFEDCVVPNSHLIVTGMRDIFAGYNAQRLGSAAVALGIGQSAFEMMTGYMQEREQFGKRLAEFQGLRWRAVECELKLVGARLFVENAAKVRLTVEGFPDAKLTAQAKISAAETAVFVTNEALQTYGAAGYWRGLDIERLVRDARMFTIGGGTIEALRNLCAKQLFDRGSPGNLNVQHGII